MEAKKVITLFGRLSDDTIISTPLPLYAHGTGEKILLPDTPEFKPGIHNTFVEVIWSIAGTGEVTLWDRRFQLNPGDIFYYLTGEDHEIRALSETWHSRWFNFDGALAEAIMSAYQFPRHQSVTRPYPDHLFRQLEENLSSPDPFQIRAMTGLCLTILAHIGADKIESNSSASQVNSCLAFIRANLSNPALDIAMLCKHFAMHRTTLTRLFRQRLNRSPARYILDMRYDRARSLLKGSLLPIAEVAKRCGFSNVGSFSRLIQRSTGMSPTEYRHSTTENL